MGMITGFDSHAGFTITSSKLQLVEIVNEKNKFFLHNVDEAYFNEPLNFEKDKETKIFSLLQSAFNEMQIKQPLKSGSVSFTLPLDYFLIFQSIYDNTLLHNDLIEEFQWELSILYPFVSAKDYAVQYMEIEKNNIVTQNTAMVVAVQRKILQLLFKFASENNLKLKFIDNSHFASERALSVSEPLTDKTLTLSVYFNNKYLSLIYSSLGKPFHFRNYQLTSAGEIPALLQKELLFKDQININKNLIDAAYIAGEDISQSMAQSLSRSAGLDFIHFNPFNKIKPFSRLVDNNYFTEKYNSFSPAAGIAFRAA
jgi:hypothetical protein